MTCIYEEIKSFDIFLFLFYPTFIVVIVVICQKEQSDVFTEKKKKNVELRTEAKRDRGEEDT